MPIKVVFFDMDGTLVYPIRNEVERLMEIYHGLGLSFEREMVRKH